MKKEDVRIGRQYINDDDIKEIVELKGFDFIGDPICIFVSKSDFSWPLKTIVHDHKDGLGNNIPNSFAMYMEDFLICYTPKDYYDTNDALKDIGLEGML